MFESQSYTGLRHMAEQVAAARETTGLATGVQACEALRQVQKTQDILDGVHADLLARVEESEAYTDEGASSTTSWARQQLRMSPGEAGRRRKAGNTLRTLPGVAAALGIGKIRAGHVDEFTGGITKLGADVMADVEELLLPIAESETPQVLREAISYLHEVLHPDDLDDKYAKGMERRDIKVAKCGQGWHLTGFLDQEVGAKFNEWLKTVSRPECEGDDRTPAGRRVDAFDRLLDTPDTPADTEPDADTSADADDADAEPATGTEADAETNAGTGADSETDVGASAGERRDDAADGKRNGREPRHADTRLLVLADLAALLRLAGAEPATLSGFGHIGQQLLGYLTCGADLTGILTDGLTDGPTPQANVLNVGRTHRLATGRQRAAVIARQDGTCAAPGCGLTRLEIHHARWWFRDGGRTDLDNLVGLCSRCHHLVHQDRLTIEADGSGGFNFRRRTGRRIDDHTRVNKQRVRDALAKLRHTLADEETTDPAPTPMPKPKTPPRQPRMPRIDAHWFTPLPRGATYAEERLYEYIGHHIT